MKERPIICTGEMVRAILEGRKTQTRRTVTPQPTGEDGWIVGQLRDSENAYRLISCPYGTPGDHLWVRESWRTWKSLDRTPPRDMAPNGPTIYYEADRQASDGAGKLRPPLHMPRWASRITLKIVSVRVERLHDINGHDSGEANPWVWAITFRRLP